MADGLVFFTGFPGFIGTRVVRALLNADVDLRVATLVEPRMADRAREVAARLGVDLVEGDVRPAVTALLPLLVWHSDEPLADPAVAASYLLCRAARECGTVVLLSGQGADELYHGYRSHRAMRLARSLSAVPPPLVRAATAVGEALAFQSGAAAEAGPRRALKLLRFLGASGGARILSLADWASTAVRSEILSPEARRDGDGEVYRDYLALFERSRAKTDEERWTYVLFKTFLPALNLAYGDRTSMAVSVELRVPYLDRALVEQAGRIPLGVKVRGGRQKWVLAEAARDWLPPRVRRRPKTGFGAPIRRWLAGELREQTRATLLGERFAARGLFSRPGVERLLSDLEAGRRDVAYIIWALLTFELWARTFVDGDGTAPCRLAA
jgi:asparagine synthase (glutamine-hydrolysing)